MDEFKDKKEELLKKSNLLIEYFELNNINPTDALKIMSLTIIRCLQD